MKKGISRVCCSLIFLIVPILFLVFRLGYDGWIYYFGGTLIIRNESRSGFDYLLQLPPGYSSFSKPRPLLIYLHGSGEVNKDVAILKTMNPVFWSNGHVAESDFPFIVVSPITKQNGWKPEQLKILVEELLSDRNRFRIDRTRVYLTGFSMGGFGTFKTASEYPQLFAAIAPVAGGGEPNQQEKIKDLPVWAFHGTADTAVEYKHSKEMIEALQSQGNQNVKLTTWYGAGHGIVKYVYRDPNLYQWFLKHNKQPKEL